MILSLAAFCLPVLIQLPVEATPVARADDWWKQRHQLINTRGAEAGDACQVVFIGDSITHFWEGFGKDIWQEHYAPLHAVNLGIAGDSTQHVLWRLQNGNLDALRPSLAVIMIGTNNAQPSAPTDTAAGIEAIVDALQKQRPEMEILLLNIFPRGATADDGLRLKNDSVNSIIAGLDARSMVRVVDIKDFFLSDNELLNTSIMPDLLHLSKEGYALWQAGIAQELREHFAVKFLRDNMSATDKESLSSEFLYDNTRLAFAAFDQAPWRHTISHEMFLNDVLPYAQLNEQREDWRKMLSDIAQPLIADCTTTTEAALKLNAQLFSELEVVYSTERNRADQAPSETIETGLASCSGLSILLADACRSVGIPARVAGIAEWPGSSGNHSWVEIWDDGWHFLGAAEPDAQGLDHAWFKGRVSAAIPGGINAVWAASFKRTDNLFPLPWLPEQDFVFAQDVTARYTADKTNSDAYAAIYDVALSYFTADDAARDTFTFDMNLDALVAGDIERARQQVWRAYRERPQAELSEKDYAVNQVSSDGHVSAYTVKEVGERPPAGWPLVIAMHGGGSVPKEFNDSQWQHMQIYYKDHPEVSGYKYLALRAPNDSWNGFYDSYVWPLVTQLIKQFAIFGDIDQNRVHLIGYSHGGYGAFAIGTRIPHRFASVHASAAAPTGGVTTAATLRNTPFSYMVGELDTAYGRAALCRKFFTEVSALRDNSDVDSYPVEFSFILNNGHGGLPDRDLLTRQLQFSRKAHPSHLTWQLSDDATPELSWLSIDQPKSGQKIDAVISGQEISVVSNEVSGLTIWLDEKLVALDQQVVLKHNGKHTLHTVQANLSALCESMLLSGDPNQSYAAKLAQ
ncbi:MAG: lysophospholipase L1-like esterase/pimeloyl-ACP methyl ester carboxylesterase [Myxococcota bacterium]|jgi:lysophospholipase L1-like esterase/pimeloyl-ACP methyl ester carboxylesterase